MFILDLNFFHPGSDPESRDKKPLDTEAGYATLTISL
jgi:hypothetical protein